MSRTERKNISKYYLRYFLYYIANTLITGGLLQSFMLENGISSGKVSFFMALIQIVQAAAMLLLAPVLERKKDIIRINADACFALLPMMAVILLICLVPMSPDLRYLLLIISGCVAYLAFAVIAVLEYKLPYHIMRMEHYGSVVSLAGAAIGLSSLLTSTLFSLFLKRFAYPKVMAVFISAASVCLLLSIIVGRSYRRLAETEETDAGSRETEPHIAETVETEPQRGTEENRTGTEKTESDGKDSIFRYAPFRRLFLPNLIRGYATGTFGLLTTVGYYYGILGAGSAGLMVAVSNVIILGGCVLYSRLAARKIDGILILVSSAALCVVMPAMLAGRNTAVFIILYAVGTFFRNIVDYACPVICVEIVDYEHVGQFSSWRIALYMLGGALSGFLTVPMLDFFGGIPTLLINGFLFLLMGIGYWRAAGDRTLRNGSGESSGS